MFLETEDDFIAKSLFDIFDSQGYGSLTSEEFEVVFRLIDLDDDLQIKFDEFLAWTKVHEKTLCMPFQHQIDTVMDKIKETETVPFKPLCANYTELVPSKRPTFMMDEMVTNSSEPCEKTVRSANQYLRETRTEFVQLSN